MKLPKPDEATLLVRTDFSNQEAWQALRETVTTPNEDGFTPALHVVDDPVYLAMSPAQVKTLLPPGEDMIFIADNVAQVEPEQPILATCTRHLSRRRRTLRVAAQHLASIEGNIRLGNMDWLEYVESADGTDGVFRGF